MCDLMSPRKGIFDSDSWSAFFRHKLSDVVPTSPLRTLPRSESVRSVSSASAEMTVTQVRFIPGRLYGREKEIAAVKETLDKETKLQQVLLITGTSGVGKTVLADKLRTPTLRAGGRYVMGKYDAMQRSEPYSGITAACRSLCEDLVHKPPAFERLEKLREELGSSVHVLAKLIPTILKVVGVDASQDDDGGIAEAQNRFQYAIKRFLSIVASWGPLVFLLDDLQWADIESLQLLEVLVKDRDIEGLVVVGCYRSNEVDETHMFAKWIRDVEALKEEVLVSKIFLQNLEVEAVNQMLADLLSTEKEKTQDLSGIVHKKTLGNAFFVVQFLKMLTEQDVLAYNLGIMKWVWSVEDIERNTKATENVVDLMEKKMTGLPRKLAEILPLAACLGSTFQKQSLTVVADVLFRQRRRSVPGQQSFDTDEWLESCGEEGFIEKAGSNSYRWVHDKIQEAALALIVPEKLPFLRYRVGEVLLRNLSDDELQRNAFVVSNLLNEASERTIINEATQLKIAEVNLEAGHRAIASASFGQAVLYLQRGIQRLPTDHWETQYDLSLELFSCAAEAEYCTGDVVRMEEHCNAIIKQKDRPLPEKFRAYNILVDSMGNRNKLGEAMELILDVLETLDCKLPKGRYLFHTLVGIGRIKLTIKKYTPEDIARLGEMEDESQKEAMRLLDQLASHAYMAEHPLLPLAIFKSLRLSIQHGISEYSPPAFATVGLILCGNLGVSTNSDHSRFGEAPLS
jgi:predicted ATPase